MQIGQKRKVDVNQKTRPLEEIVLEGFYRVCKDISLETCLRFTKLGNFSLNQIRKAVKQCVHEGWLDEKRSPNRLRPLYHLTTQGQQQIESAHSQQTQQTSKKKQKTKLTAYEQKILQMAQ